MSQQIKRQSALDQIYKNAPIRQLHLIRFCGDTLRDMFPAIAHDNDPMKAVARYDDPAAASYISQLNKHLHPIVWFVDGGIKDYATATSKLQRTGKIILDDINRVSVLPHLPTTGLAFNQQLSQMNIYPCSGKDDWSIEKYSGIITCSLRAHIDQAHCQIHIGNPHIFIASQTHTHKIHRFIREKLTITDPTSLPDLQTEYRHLVSSLDYAELDLMEPHTRMAMFNNLKDIQTLYHAKAIKASARDWTPLYRTSVNSYNQSAAQEEKPLIDARIIERTLS